MTRVVRDAFGRERQATIYPDGESWACPFCTSAVIPSRTGDACGNPWCPANPAADCDAARARFVDADHAEALREQERRWNQERAAFSRRYAEETREREASVMEERREQAVKAGQCAHCATADYYRPRFVRHRAGHPHARS